MDPRLTMELCWVFERESAKWSGRDREYDYPRPPPPPPEDIREGERLRRIADELHHVATFDGWGDQPEENSGTEAVFGHLHARYFPGCDPRRITSPAGDHVPGRALRHVRAQARSAPGCARSGEGQHRRDRGGEAEGGHGRARRRAAGRGPQLEELDDQDRSAVVSGR